MKDQYFGDVNDYCKYRLLRSLTRAGLSLGVCWMLTEPDGRTDGKHLGYLDKPRQHRQADPELFEWLQTAIHRDRDRRTARIEASGLLGDAIFQTRILRDDSVGRLSYFAHCQELFRGRDLVFFDPDNGLERSKRPGNRGSSKYIYWPEVEATFASGASVLIYQHFPREERTGFIARMKAELQARTGAAEIEAIPTSHVLFLFAAHERHRASIAPTVAAGQTFYR